MSNALDEITTKAGAGEPLSDADAQALFLTHDIIALGVAADAARTRLHADRVTFVRVADVPLHGDEDASWPASTGEVRIAGALEDFDVALARARQIAAVAAVPVSVFSLADLESEAARRGEPIAAILARVREAGIEAIAEAPFDRLHDPVAAFRGAAGAGVLVGRVTLDRIPPDGMLALYRRVRDVQRATGAIRAFAPLPRRMASAHPTTGFEDVKHVAIARLVLDAIDTIQVDWRLYGPKLAQVALTFGADDLDAVPASDEAPDGPRRAPLEEVRRNITAASRVPVERDGRFTVING